MAKKLTNEEFLQKLRGLGRDDLVPLEEYKGSHVKIKWCCLNKKCNNEWKTTPYHIYAGEGCPKCAKENRKRNKMLNINKSFAEENPSLVKYFKDKSVAYNYSPWSIKTAVLVCPQCGSEKEYKLTNLNHGHFSCDICGDGISFPNRFVREILKSKGILFESEWSNNNEFVYKYDIKLEKDGKIILLELDGEYHDKDKKTKERDKIKDKIAKDNEWELIRINVNGSDTEKIYKNLLESKLTKYYNIEGVDILKCEELSQKSLVPQIWEYYNDNLNLTYKDIAKHFQISVSTVSRKLKIGRKIGKVKNYRINSSKILEVYKGDKKIKQYNSVTECADSSMTELGVVIRRDGIYRAIREGKQYKGYTFKYVT